MIHLKLFEDFDYDIYEIDDYVCLDPNYFTDHKRRFGKIIRKENAGPQYSFDVLFTNGKVMWSKPSMVIRKLNKTEIDNFEAELSANKYNI